jgi:predicted O-methyltransferase YrrM
VTRGSAEGGTGQETALQRYVEERFATEDAVLVELRGELERRGLPLIHVSPATGRLLQILVSAVRARRVLEIGTLGGYSAIWMARGLPPGGRLLSIELDPHHAALARDFIARAGLEERVEVQEGDAREIVARLGPDGGTDVVFLDADKEGYVTYAVHALRLLRPGGLLLADNAFWSGRVLAAPEDEASRGIQEFNEYLATSGELIGTIVPVGDGLALGVKAGRARTSPRT